MTTLSDHYKFYNTDDATAAAYHVKNGKTAYGAAGKVTGSGYFPAMMQFDGSTGYYNKTQAVSGNVFTQVTRYSIAPFTGGGIQRIVNFNGTGGSRIIIAAYASDHATTAFRNKIQCLAQNTAAATICNIFSSNEFADGQPHTQFFSFEATAGTAINVIDGVSEIDTGAGGYVITTGTLVNAGTVRYGVGARPDTAADKVLGNIGFVGYRDAYLTNWSDFMHPDGTPKNIEATLNTVWGAAPLFWNENGDMVNNQGSAGAMTKNGTINVAAASSWS